MEQEIVYALSFWIIYSVLGWAIETIYCAILDGHFSQRGFLNGPFVPIYGFGAMIILYFLNKYVENLLYIFIFGVILTTILEYITSWILEVFLKLRLWDYSKNFININGRVCFLNSMLFGFLCVILVAFFHPNIKKLVERFDFNTIKIVTLIIIFCMFVDFIFSVIGVINLKNRLINASKLKLEIEEKIMQNNQKLKYELGKLKYNEKRMLKTFPKIKSNRFQSLLEEIKKHYNR